MAFPLVVESLQFSGDWILSQSWARQNQQTHHLHLKAFVRAHVAGYTEPKCVFLRSACVGVFTAATAAVV